MHGTRYHPQPSRLSQSFSPDSAASAHYKKTIFMTNQPTLFIHQLRQLVYLIIMVLSVVLLWHMSDIYKSALIVEHAAVENTQAIIILMTAISFGLHAWNNSAHRSLLLLLASLALAAFIREHDAYLEATIPYVSWYFCWLFPIAAIINIIRTRHNFGKSLTAFLQTNGYHMMVTAVIIIIPIAQCLGHRSFLADLLGDTKINTFLVRRILEEPIELIGYIQILLASVESSLELRKK